MNLKTSKKHFYFLLLMLFLPLFFTGCNRENRNQKPPPPRVTTTKIAQQDVPIYIDAIGQAIPPVTVYIRPQAAGMLIKANIEQGAIVKEGDILYEIDQRPYQAVLDQAVAQLAHDVALLEYAEQAVKRYKTVVEDEFISILNYEQFVSTATAARAQVDLDMAVITAAQINLGYCKVFAPVSGKISYFNVYVGNILVVDDPNQITVIRPSYPIDITFSLPQHQFELIRREQGDEGEWKFVATLPESLDHPFEGITYFIDNQIDQNTGTILLKGRLPNANLELWPGEFIRVKVLHKMAPNALTVPPSSVLMGRDGPYIYIVDQNGNAAVENVTVLTRTEEYIAIQSIQVHAGDTVVVDGQINIAPGLMVNAVSIDLLRN